LVSFSSPSSKDGEAGFLEGLQIPADRAGADAGAARQFVDGDAGAPGLDFPQDFPLTNDFRVAHGFSGWGRWIVPAPGRTTQ
jgi:hypothetical protein